MFRGLGVQDTSRTWPLDVARRASRWRVLSPPWTGPLGAGPLRSDSPYHQCAAVERARDRQLSRAEQLQSGPSQCAQDLSRIYGYGYTGRGDQETQAFSLSAQADGAGRMNWFGKAPKYYGLE